MAEIKSTFTQGKMNQDLDERMLPNGQYREALNIQVSTSEESDIGTAQNILGNTLINKYPNDENVVGGNWTCVGAIADEKNDALYWFIHNDGGRDAIIEYKNGVITPVVVTLEGSASIEDVKTTFWHQDFSDTTGGTVHLRLTSLGTKKNPKVKEGDQLIEFQTAGGNLYNPSSNIFVTSVNYKLGIVTINSSIYSGAGTAAIGNLVKFRDMQTYQPNRSVLGFTGDLITGINIISGDDEANEDKLLLWTDNVNEPRKINIQRCKDGTEDSALNVHTKLIVDGESTYKDISAIIQGTWNGQGVGTNQIDFYTAQVQDLEIGDQLMQIKNWNFITSSGGGTNPTFAYITDISYTGGMVTLDTPVFKNGNMAPGDVAIFRKYDKLKEEHINVIKKNPTSPPTIKLEANTRGSSKLITDRNGVPPVDTDGNPSPGYIFTVDGMSGVTTGITNDTNGGTQFVILQNNNTVQKKEGDIIDLYIEQSIQEVYVGFGVDGEVPSGDQPDVISETNWRVGDVLLVARYNPIGAQNQGPLQFNYQSRVRVLSKSNPYEKPGAPGEYEQYFEVELIEVKDLMTPNPVPPLSTGVNLFQVTLEEKEAGIFQTKIPRFAYRYKYEDNEYSAFSPWSEPAFLPSGFSYHPTKNPYNLGMVNYAKSIIVQDFVPADIPSDVVQVDLLYKEEHSPTVYSIDSFKPDDPVDSGYTYNPWNSIGSTPINFYNNMVLTDKGSYEITSDNVRGAVAENQLLRAWDNVPRKALAQEITGNRVVYGNYLQNYNLINKPIIKAGYRTRALTSSDYIDRSVAKKSLKSFRDYQVGVIYGDKYGRETPVFTEDDAAFNLPFKECKDVNQIYASLYGPQPSWADYYKVYVKEISGEYYNLVMDRVYRAEDDDNLWISFPSSDRNKITEESFISLKKQVDLNNPVTDENKFKVIDIKNQAPEFIKSKYVQIASITSTDLNITNFPGDLPVSNATQISFDSTGWNSNFTSLFDAHERKLLEERLSLIFYDSSTNAGGVTRVSNRYHISSYSDDSSNVIFSLKDEIDEQTDSWIATSGDYNDDVSVKLFKEEIINKQEFEGRFFVKIVQNEITDKFIEGQIERQVNERVSGSASVYYLADEDGTWDANGNPNYQNTQNNFDSNNTEHFRSDSYSDWQRNFKFGTGQVSKKWFFDQCYFVSTQSNFSLDPNNSKDEGPNFFRGIHTITSSTYTSGGSNAFQDEPNFYKMGRTYMNLSFGCVGEDLHDIGNNQQGKDHGELDWGSLRKVSNQFSDSFDSTKHNNQWKTGSNIEKKLIPGTKFKFKDKNGNADDTEYEIKNVMTRRSYNFHPWGWVQAKINDYQNGSDWGGVGYSGPEGQAALYRMGEFGKKENRRVTFVCEIVALTGGKPNDPTTSNSTLDPINHDDSQAKNDTTIDIEFTTTFVDEDDNDISVSPAVWETEPKDLPDLNLYYEASQAYPLSLDVNDSTKSTMWAPVGCRVWCNNPQYNRTSPEKNYDPDLVDYNPNHTKWIDPQIIGWDGNEVEIYPGLDVDTEEAADEAGQTSAYVGKVLRFFRPDMSFTSATITGVTKVQANSTGMMSADKVRKVTVDLKKTVGLAWSNCFSFQNGVESDRIRDDFNRPTISNGVRVSTTIEEPYAEERRGNGLIYSGLYNSTNGINSLNQFIQAEKITKDLSPRFGTIQKLFQRKISLIAFCEDRVVSITAGKDTLYSADGNPQLIASNAVLGDASPFVGDYGISKNPESFAKESYRAYFTDKQRGAVLRLSMDGLTPISKAGMDDYFKDNLKPASKLIGSYDDRKKEYNLTINKGVQSYPDSTTVSFKEDVTGWVSFKSFIPDYGLSMANDYYTFYEGKLFKHHDNDVRNWFYDKKDENEEPITDSSFIEAVLNDAPSTIKSFRTLNYEGDFGWVATINTNKQSGTVSEFIEKEGKYFNYIRGEEDTIDTAAFNFQGIGTVNEIQ